jgi:hypothetical protein
MEKLISCKNNPVRNVEITMVPGFPQLGVLCGGICAECSARPLLRQTSRVVTFTEGEMIECVPAMMIGGLKAQLAVLKILGAGAKEIEDIERKIQLGEQ